MVYHIGVMQHDQHRQTQLLGEMLEIAHLRAKDYGPSRATCVRLPEHRQADTEPTVGALLLHDDPVAPEPRAHG
eukprot:CAMPEP_0204548220 /NCGR_PEP_ID=MMETSP0661-20131031/23410_1 /ASSEMBLY_ACC=CAM_ASM_000606 /TAXON_ID=109239 /ORGANISM="Alexandrium margalefi, Strain AMGDE01CS-322" /LENGTH=73 /DNA_ID=CAMNT_0051555125 /DNA_START=1 /DNA_END=219 /DNA_ORIENTATION=-